LLGQLLVRALEDGTVLAGRIVETEAYCGPKDAASHAFKARRTERNESMYGRPGTAYVYFTYGMHYCMNVVCGREGHPVAALLRALEPVAGIERMRELRAIPTGKAAARRTKNSAQLGERGHPRDEELCSGPARLCHALGIGRAQDGLDLATSEVLFIAGPAPGAFPAIPVRDIKRARRIGVDYAGEWAANPLRFLVASSPHVSKPVPGTRRAKLVRMEKRLEA
jgi:DNA-3-methyladenine glycosylase